MLEAAGHTVVKYDMPDKADLYALYSNVLFADDFAGLLEVINKEKRVDPAIRSAVLFGKVARWTPKLVRRWVLNPLLSLVSSTTATGKLEGMLSPL